MKKLVALVALSVAVCVCGAPAVHAQQLGQGRPGIGRGFQSGLTLLQLPAPLATKLKLTDEQKSKLDSSRGGIRTAIQEARQSGGDQQANRQKMQEVAQKANADALAVLTPEQKTTFTAWQAEAAKYQGLGRAGIGLLSVEGLSDDQKSKLKTLGTETGEKRRTLFQSAQGGDRQAVFQQMRALETDTESAVRKILTEDQVKQFDAGLPPQIGQRRPNANQQ